MTMREKIALSWSGGIPGLLMLMHYDNDPKLMPHALVTTTNYNGRIYTHGISKSLLEKQVEELGLILEKVQVPSWPDEKQMKKAFEETVNALKKRGIKQLAFADIHNKKNKSKHEEFCELFNCKPLFPLWGKSTDELLDVFFESSHEAIVSTGHPPEVGRLKIGVPFDQGFVSKLGKKIDPLGEKDEFHTFVHAGPRLKNNLPVKKGHIVFRDKYYFCDLSLS
jgi:diphthamide synthase (EF-2-diphthine--ammonia ligase)